MRPALPIPLLLATFSAAAAQDPVLVRSTDVAVLRLQGPQRIRSAFLPTNLGTLLAAKESLDFWELLRGAFRDRLRGLGDDVGGNLATLVEGLDGYAGDITLALSMTPHPEAWAGISPDVGGVLVLEPDGRTDLPAIAAAVRKGLSGSRFEVEEVAFGERKLPVVRTSERGGVVLPTMMGERLVAFFGESLDAAVAPRLVADGDPFVPDAEFARAPIALRVDLAALVATQLEDPSYTVSSVDPQALARATGLASLRELRLTVRPNGPHVEIESGIVFAEDVPRGLFAGFMPDSQEPPALVALAPLGARYWQAGKFRPDLLYDATIAAIACYLGDDGETVEQRSAKFRKQFAEQIGCDLGTDLFAHLDDDAVILGSLFGAPDDDEDVDPAQVGADGGTVLFAFGMRDRAKFEAGWEEVRKTLGPFLWSAETPVEHAGVTVHVDDDGVWAVLDDLFVIAFGDEAEAWTFAFLDHRAAVLREGTHPSDLPRDVERRVRQAPAGFQGCGGFDTRSVMGLPIFELLDLEDEVGALVGNGWGKAFADLRPFMAKHHVDRAVGFAAWSGNRWRYRVLW